MSRNFGKEIKKIPAWKKRGCSNFNPAFHLIDAAAGLVYRIGVFLSQQGG
jgi:hypothetical protein